MGEVWLAEDTRLHRQVALKMVRSADSIDEAARDRLMREARAAAALNHPHIATVHDVIEDQGRVVIVFEYVEGETLSDRLRRGPLPPPEAVTIAAQIATALAAAHAHGVVHRDLKPANVIVGADGHVKVLDFGIARMLAVGTTGTAGSLPSSSAVGFIGTPSYAAPEQMVSAAVDERADLYALGVVLFEMISGRRPFAGNDPVQLASAKLSEDAPPLSSTGTLVPPALERFVASLLERDRADRPASAAEALAQLKAIYGHDPAPRRKAGFAVSAAAVAALVALAAFGAWELNRFARPAAVDPSAPPVIAVLPLANVSGDPSKDYVAAGIAESLIASLASLPSVTVLSRASVSEARTRAKTDAALAKDLGASYIVTGSVQESSGTLKVSLSLVKPDRTVAWGDSVEAPFDRIFELQARLATALADALVVRASASERERVQQQPTSSAQAITAYWQGRALMERRDSAGNVAAAIAAFTEAITIDPRFALAHAALGEAYWQRYVETRDQAWVAKATESGVTALRLDANHPQVRYTLALTLAGSGKLDEATEELTRALALRPNYEDARRQLGVVLARRGDIDGAVAQFQQAIALRPTGWANWSQMGVSLFQASRFREAAAAFTKVIELQPDNSFGFQQLGAAYQNLGEYELALDNYRKAIAIRPTPQAFSNIGVIHHLRREYSQAVEAYQRALELRPNSHITWRNLGDSYTRLGRRADAAAAYDRAIVQAEAELRVDSTDATTLSALAVYLAKAGRQAEAQSRIGAALADQPSDPLVTFRAAEVHALGGRRTDAVAMLQQAVARGMSLSRIREEEDFESLQTLESYRKLLGGEIR
jgi:serine/threonine protein kinase/Flp pilus assembly protein TadD